MEEAGAAAVVLHSLFEEQIEIESHDLHHFLEAAESYAESISYFPNLQSYNLGPKATLTIFARPRKHCRSP